MQKLCENLTVQSNKDILYENLSLYRPLVYEIIFNSAERISNYNLFFFQIMLFESFGFDQLLRAKTVVAL